MSETKPVLWNRNFVQCCISYFLMNFAFYMLMPTMPVYLVEELGISTSEVGMVLSSYTIGLLCVRPFSGYLVDCFSRKPLYVFAFTIFACLFAGYWFVMTVYTIMAVRFIQGGFMGLTSVSGNTITIDVIPSKRRGEGMGFYGLTINLAMSLAPLVAVGLYDRHGFFWIIGVALVIGVGRDRLRRADPLSETGESASSGLLVGSFYLGKSASCGLGLFAGRYTLWDVALVRGIIW